MVQTLAAAIAWGRNVEVTAQRAHWGASPGPLSQEPASSPASQDGEAVTSCPGWLATMGDAERDAKRLKNGRVWESHSVRRGDQVLHLQLPA